MPGEIDILKIVADNPSISQRKIAERTGLSLGQVNFLIKKCVKKGFIKIEGQTTKSIKYNLTPKGISEKAASTLEYIRISCRAILALTDRIKDLVQEYESSELMIFVFGSDDEMLQIIKLALSDSNIPWKSLRECDCIPEKINSMSGSAEYVILCWDSDYKEKLSNYHVKVINILE